MTYTVSSVTLNSSIPYHTSIYHILNRNIHIKAISRHVRKWPWRLRREAG